MYAATESHRSLAPLGMTGRRVVVIPNAVRDLYLSIPAYIALCEHPHKPQFAEAYAADESYRSLAPLGMTTLRGQPPVAALIKRQKGPMGRTVVLDKRCYKGAATRNLQIPVYRGVCGRSFVQIPRLRSG